MLVHVKLIHYGLKSNRYKKNYLTIEILYLIKNRENI